MNRIKKLAFKHVFGRPEEAHHEYAVRESKKKKHRAAVIVTNSKGGVGKSTVATAIALNLAEKTKIGVLDADIASANLPSILHIPEDKKAEVKSDTIIPLSVTPNLELYSIATLIDRDKVVSIPESGQDIFIRDASEIVKWQAKKLIIDLPGGTNMFLIAKKHFSVLGALIVTVPNQIEDTRRIIDLCLHNRVNIIGLCENFSGAVWGNGEYVVTQDNEYFAPFGLNSMEKVCSEFGITYFGNIPLFQDFSMDKVRRWKTVSYLSKEIEKIL